MDPNIKIINDRISRKELADIATTMEWSFVKAVVDVMRNVMAVGGSMHVDEESALLENGSAQENLWGINLDPSVEGEDWLEFDSMINIRPWQNNRTRGVEDPKIQERIREAVRALVSG